MTSPHSDPPSFDSIDHLSAEAVAAFVDGELAPRARVRALKHLMFCPECAEDVATQRHASAALHNCAAPPSAPGDLFSRLSSIPSTCPTDGPDATSSVCRPADSVWDLLDTVYRRGVRAMGYPVSRSQKPQADT